MVAGGEVCPEPLDRVLGCLECEWTGEGAEPLPPALEYPPESKSPSADTTPPAPPPRAREGAALALASAFTLASSSPRNARQDMITLHT